MKRGKKLVAALLGTALLAASLSGCGSTGTSDRGEGEYQ